MLKKILLGLLVLFIIIQFIRPARNQSAGASRADITAVYIVPENIQKILQRSCNDCHSNHTTYPWYANVQPFGLWLQNHINEGKDELNFSDFGNYSKKRQAHKLEEVAEMVEHDEMPLGSYTIIHKNAKLSKDDAAALEAWAKGLQMQILAQPRS